MCDTGPDPQAVHCPHCGAEPGTPCKTPSGKAQIDHAERMHLAYALVHPESGFKQGEAERYRKQWPDVQAQEVICEASAAQVRWWERWGRKLSYNRQRYESEHGPDRSISDDNVGMPVSELLEQLKQAEPIARRRERKRK